MSRDSHKQSYLEFIFY